MYGLSASERPAVFDLGDDPSRVRTIGGDIADRMSLERVVRDHGIRHVLHLPAWEVPLCRQDPPRSASINVTGTEAAASTSGS